MTLTVSNVQASIISTKTHFLTSILVKYVYEYFYSIYKIEHFENHFKNSCMMSNAWHIMICLKRGDVGHLSL